LAVRVERVAPASEDACRLVDAARFADVGDVRFELGERVVVFRGMACRFDNFDVCAGGAPGLPRVAHAVEFAHGSRHAHVAIAIERPPPAVIHQPSRGRAVTTIHAVAASVERAHASGDLRVEPRALLIQLDQLIAQVAVVNIVEGKELDALRQLDQPHYSYGDTLYELTFVVKRVLDNSRPTRAATRPVTPPGARTATTPRRRGTRAFCACPRTSRGQLR
jgi:hypothetical protein